MRTKNSMINIAVSVMSYVIVMAGSFVTRKIFTSVLGLEAVGIEGAFLNIVSALAIVEMGLGVGIVYTLYKPISEGDWPKISSILNFLKKSYILISLIVFGLGVIVSFFVSIPIKEDFSKTWLSGIFILYVMDILSSYLFSHKRAIFIADQKNYVNNAVHIFAQIFLFIFQILVLKIFKSFELYLICKIIFRLSENIVISILFDRKYKLINLKNAEKLPSSEKKDFFRNIKALLFHRMAGFSLTSTSSVLIMAFAGLRESGIYYNYMLVSNALISVSNEFFNGIIASFGNLLSTESNEKIYDNFKILYFINFLIYSFFTVAFFNVISPFVTLWIGLDSIFPVFTVIWLSAYLYMFGIRQSILMVKVSAGIYNPDKYFALLEAVITFGLSFILVRKLGVIGVLIGNIISMTLVPNITQPYLVYNIVFKNNKLKSYYVKYFLYAVLTIFYVYVSFIICGNIKPGSNLLKLIYNFIVCLIVPNFMNLLIFYKTEEFQKTFLYFRQCLKLKSGR
ncbi:MAG: hypothetical protein LBR79_04685 [Oscillospiraceae bacterium]|nr:hypothetical protein [Oscillospiraceae bacterium]